MSTCTCRPLLRPLRQRSNQVLRRVVVSDSSVLIDLERGLLFDAAFGLRIQYCVPDLLFRRNWSRTTATDCSRRAFRSSNSTGRVSSMRHAITRAPAHFRSPTPSRWRLPARSAAPCLPAMRACGGSQLPKRSLATASSGLWMRYSKANPQRRDSCTRVCSESATTHGVDCRERRSTNVFRLSSAPVAALKS